MGGGEEALGRPVISGLVAILRESSIRSLPRMSVGKGGSRRTNCASDSQKQERVIANSLQGV